MIRNYFLIAARNFRRQKLFSLLNLIGLALGFTTTLFIGIYIWQEVRYDHFHQKADRIAWVTTKMRYHGEKMEVGTTGTKVGPALQRQFPEVQGYTRLFRSSAIFRYQNNSFEEENVVFADSAFFNIFSFPLQSGNPATALAQPNQVVITPKVAGKYFNQENPLGKTLLVNGQKEYVVTGVVEEIPDNSQIKFDLLVSFSSLNAFKEETWFPANYYTYLLLKDEKAIAPLQSKIRPFMDQQSAETEMKGENFVTFQLMPLKKVHLYADLSPLEPVSDIKYIYIFGFVALMVLLIASINYINLATARATERATEVGVRKVLGAAKFQLFWQFMGEAIILSFSAALLSLIIIYFGLPYFEGITGKNIQFTDILPPLVLGSIILLLVISFLSGSYPAVVLSRLLPARTLKGKYKNTSTALWLRKGLITFQFFISISLIACTMIIFMQLDFLQNSHLGYQKDHIVVVNLRSSIEEKFDVFKNDLKQNPAIEAMTMVYETPTKIDWGGSIKTPAMDEALTANCIPVEQNFLHTLKAELIAGRDFTGADQEKSGQEFGPDADFSMIINQTAADLMGWEPEQAIGQRLENPLPGTVVGVVKDFHYAPMKEKIGPLVIMNLKMYHQMLIRIDGHNISSTLSYMQKSWKHIAPDFPFNYHFMDEEFDRLYASEQKISKLFNVFTFLAIGLGLLGLLGLSAYTINQRTKEISIRKILGASVRQIIGLLSIDFIQLVMLAFILAVPVAWYIMSQWLMNYEYRIDMNIMVFLGSGALVVLLTLLVLTIYSLKTASRNPVETIRQE
ncbi:MAG: ABC transporter permease [Candidatus Cyclobacteriaceae bacterium M3_2C_046]